MKVRNVDETQKGVKIFISKISDKPTSITKKTACAVRLKYNSIISTRMTSAKKAEFSSQEAAPITTDTEVLESGGSAAAEKMVQSENDAVSEDGVLREAIVDGSSTSTAEMELNASFSSSERSIKELEIGSRDKSDLDVIAKENLESTSDLDGSHRSDKSESVKQPAVCIVLSEKNETFTNTANDILTSVLDVAEKQGPLDDSHQICDNVTLETSKETRTISHDQPVIQDASCSSSASEIQSDDGITIHSDQCKNSDSVSTSVVESTERETVVDSGEPTSQIEKSGLGIDLPAELSVACKSSNNAEETIVHILEELPETNVPSDSLKQVLSSQSTTKDELEGNVKNGAETRLGHIICESEERQTHALEAVSISSDAGLSLSSASSIKNSVLESGVSDENLESSSVQAPAAVTETNLIATAVDRIPSVIEAPLLTSCESNMKLVSHADSNEVHALKTAVPVSSEPSEIAADVSGPDFVKENSSVESDAAGLDCPSDMPAGLDSSILRSLASDVEERASKMVRYCHFIYILYVAGFSASRDSVINQQYSGLNTACVKVR